MADNQLLERLAQALRPGPVEPPAERVKALRDLVGSRAAAAADDNLHAEGPSRSNGAADGAAGAVDGSAPYWPEVQPSPTDDGLSGATVHPLARTRSRRAIPALVPRILSGAFAAAAVAILVAMVAAQDMPTPLREVAHGVGLPVDSTQLVAARRDADQLALALAEQDAPKVAGADAAMLKSTNKLDGEDLQEVRPRAVKLHVEALAFLRENPTPEALSDLLAPDAFVGTGQASSAAVPGEQAQPGGPTAAPNQSTPPGGSATADPTAPAVVPPEERTVTIRNISPRLDATFQVDFEVSGFTVGPGQPHAVQFSFDSGQEPTTYSGGSPWRFPLLNAIQYRSLCARVVNAAGDVDPASGNCFDILL